MSCPRLGGQMTRQRVSKSSGKSYSNYTGRHDGEVSQTSSASSSPSSTSTASTSEVTHHHCTGLQPETSYNYLFVVLFWANMNAAQKITHTMFQLLHRPQFIASRRYRVRLGGTFSQSLLSDTWAHVGCNSSWTTESLQQLAWAGPPSHPAGRPAARCEFQTLLVFLKVASEPYDLFPQPCAS